MYLASRVMIFSNDVKFARRIKSGLEETRQVTAQIFTTPDNAVAHLRDNPQDIVIMDVTEATYEPKFIYETLIAIQPELGFILLASDDTVLTNTSSTVQVIPRSTRVRQLLPLIQTITRAVHDNLPDTAQMVPLDPNGDNDTMLLQEQATPPDTVSTSALETFRRLAAEEPPMPDDATVIDLRRQLNDTPPSASANLPAPNDDPDTPRTPATLALQSTNSDTTYLDELALETFVRELEERIASANTNPELEQFIREPDFLPPTLPEIDQPLEYTSGTTFSSSPDEFEVNSADFVTERQEPQRRSQPIPEDAPHLQDTPPDVPPPELPPLPIMQDDEPLIITQPIAPTTPIADFEGDSQVLQLASVITQMSLETAAAATILLWNRQIIAASGEMPRADIEALFTQEPRLLQPTNQPQKMLFVTLNTNAKDYMVMIMPTIDQLVLVLVFSGKQPLSNIRKQTQRLVNALAMVPAPAPEAPVKEPAPQAPAPEAPVKEPAPEAPVKEPAPEAPVKEPAPEAPVKEPAPEAPVKEPAPEAPVKEPAPQAPVKEPAPQAPVKEPARDTRVRYPYTFLWLLNSPTASFSDEISRALVRSLDMQYSQLGWQIVEIDVHGTYIQLQANVPGEQPPHEYIHELMRFSADIIRAQITDEPLWSPSYLIVSPARRLDVEEVSNFINFARPQ